MFTNILFKQFLPCFEEIFLSRVQYVNLHMQRRDRSFVRRNSFNLGENFYFENIKPTTFFFLSLLRYAIIISFFKNLSRHTLAKKYSLSYREEIRGVTTLRKWIRYMDDLQRYANFFPTKHR